MKSYRVPSSPNEADVPGLALNKPAPGKRSTATMANDVVQRSPRAIPNASAGKGASTGAQADWMRSPDMMAAHGFVPSAGAIQRKADTNAAALDTAGGQNDARAEEARAAKADHARLLQLMSDVDAALRTKGQSGGEGADTAGGQGSGEMLATWSRLRASLIAHFQFEEDVLFPKIISGQTTDEGGDLGKMHTEHQEMHELMSVLRSQATGAGAGDLLSLLDEIEAHAAIENQGL